METQSNVPILRTLNCRGYFEDVRGIFKRLRIVFTICLKMGRLEEILVKNQFIGGLSNVKVTNKH